MKKQYKSSITKNHKIKKKMFFDGVPVSILEGGMVLFSLFF